MQNRIVADSDHVVLVQGGGPADQSWMDSFITYAQSGMADFPHDHPTLPRVVVTLDQLWRAIADNVSLNGQRWSVPDMGYPNFLNGLPVPSQLAKSGSNHDPDPSRGSMGHNLLHSILGNFH